MKTLRPSGPCRPCSGRPRGAPGTPRTRRRCRCCPGRCCRSRAPRAPRRPSPCRRRTLDWQHLFGRFREGQPRLPELDRRHAAQRRVDPEVVVPVHVVRELGPELARRAERLAVDELGLQYPVGRLVDGVVAGAALGRQRPLYAEGLEHQVDLGVVELAAAVRVEDLDVQDGCVSSRGFEQKDHRKLSGLSIRSAHAF